MDLLLSRDILVDRNFLSGMYLFWQRTMENANWCRIFYPKNFDAKAGKKVPTILNIHGGGFVVGNPRDDDLFNYTFANMHSVIVIALNYTKAPRARFPTPTYDLEQLILAVLS